MNKIDKQYTDLLQDILDNGVIKQDRTGTGTTSVFGRQIRHNMKDGFPLITTKKMPFKVIVTELIWFLRGDTNIKYLVDNGCNIWNGDVYKNWFENGRTEFEQFADPMFLSDDALGKEKFHKISMEWFIKKIKTDDEFAKKWGELGPIYGKQWRSWGGELVPKRIKEEGKIPYSRSVLEGQIDQISNLINELKTNPDSRRLIVNAWNVGELDQMVLPPCHYGFQVYTRELSELERRSILDNMGIPVSYTMEYLDKQNTPKRAISLMWNQRSVDTALGLPFNIASYAILLQLIGKIVNMVPEELIGNLGDTHLYSNHLEGAKEQIGRELTFNDRYKMYSKSDTTWEEGGGNSYGKITALDLMDDTNTPTRTREPYPLPTLSFSNLVDIDIMKYVNINTMNLDMLFSRLTPTDFILEGYQSHPKIDFPLSN